MQTIYISMLFLFLEIFWNRIDKENLSGCYSTSTLQTEIYQFAKAAVENMRRLSVSLLLWFASMFCLVLFTFVAKFVWC